MKVAIPTDLRSIWKGHFGDAPYFLIFSKDGPCLQLVEVKENEKYEGGHGERQKFESVMRVLGDVDAIAAWDVGPNVAKVKLEAKLKVFIVREGKDIEEFLKALLKKMGVRSFEGELFYEVIDGRTEHAGFREPTGEFERMLFETVGPDRKKVKASIAVSLEGE